MRLLKIETNKGNMIDGGFRHTVFESGTVNGKRCINILASTKFDGVLWHPEHIEQFKKNPDEFLRSAVDEDNSQRCNSHNNDGDAA